MLLMFNLLVYLIYFINFGSSFEDGCIQSFCSKVNFGSACTSCRSYGGVMLSFQLLATKPKVTSQAFQSLKPGTYWISDEENCSTKEQTKENCQAFDLNNYEVSHIELPCSQGNNFLCFMKNSTCEKCSDEEQKGPSKTAIIATAITVPGSIVLLAITVCCLIFRRFRKPKKYAVPVESASYHTKDQEKETEDDVYSNFDFALSH